VRCRKRPDHLCGDKAYGSRADREALRGRGIAHAIPERDDVIKARARPGLARSPTAEVEQATVRDPALVPPGKRDAGDARGGLTSEQVRLVLSRRRAIAW
jgi:hypothetical protein